MTRPAGGLREGPWLVLGAVTVTSLAFASVVPSLDPGRLSAAPILYSRDAVSHAAIIQQAIEGNPLAGHRFGYPFGASWYDYPVIDWGTIAIVKAMSLVTGDYALIFNLLFLLGFPLAFASAYLVARRFDLTAPFAFVAGSAFALASYHFERLSLHGHLFLTMYWVVPVYFLLAWRLVHPGPQPPRARRALNFIGIAVLSGFGIYYTTFGLIGLTAALLYALTQRPPRQAFVTYLSHAATLVLGVLLQALPTFITRMRLGNNPLAVERSPLESETWALRPIQLLLPHVTHRLEPLARKAEEIYTMAFAGNENVMSSVGVVGSLGLVVMLLMVATALAGRELDERLRFLMLITTVALAFATIGGLGLLLSLLGFTEIRSWNRLSIFIQYAGTLATLIALRPTVDRYSTQLRRWGTPLALVAVLGLVWFDQTPAPRAATLDSAVSQRVVTAKFVHELEARLPRGAAIYQLPFTGFPEGWRLRNYDAYEFMKPYLESTDLRFNLGGMKGREGDRFYRSLAQRSVETQIRVIRQLGFSGIYVDRMGLVDYGTKLIADLERELGADAATYRSDRRAVYFDLGNAQSALPTGSLTPSQAAALTDFEPTFPRRRLSD